MDRIDEKIIEAYNGIVGKQVLSEGKLTKKDFNGLASLIKNAKTLTQLQDELVDWASTMNPMFNTEQFRKAAGLSESTEMNEIVNAQFKKGHRLKVTSGDSKGKVGMFVKSEGKGVVIKTSTGEINVPVNDLKVISKKEYEEAE